MDNIYNKMIDIIDKIKVYDDLLNILSTLDKNR